MNLNRFKTIVFDCDGVLFDSNKIKSQAFFDTVKHYGEKQAEMLVRFHIENGGVSRYEKFRFFLEKLSGDAKFNEHVYGCLLESFAFNVKDGYEKCAMASCLPELRRATSSATWMVASGGDQEELRALFHVRNIANLFDGGIFGSPDSKQEIINRSIETNKIKFPALMVGDSRYDHMVTINNDIEFVFLHGWSEFSNWKDYCRSHDIKTYAYLDEILR